MKEPTSNNFYRLGDNHGDANPVTPIENPDDLKIGSELQSTIKAMGNTRRRTGNHHFEITKFFLDSDNIENVEITRRNHPRGEKIQRIKLSEVPNEFCYLRKI